MKVSHEVPKCLLEKSREFNTYDFCLPHLMDEDEEYRDFFLESKRLGRYIIMDNSLHELKDKNGGQCYDHKRLRYWVKELEPDEFVVPDVWMDKTQTLVQAKYWKQFETENTTFVAVVQGKTFNEAIICYQTLKDLGYKKIAISYGAEWYDGLYPTDPTYPDLARMMGRYKFISHLYNLNIVLNSDRIHLLGCQLPQEFICYEYQPYIESIDTSNPIMATLDGVRYGGRGLMEKPKSNMNDNYEISIEDIDMELLEYNVLKFKEINKIK